MEGDANMQSFDLDDKQTMKDAENKKAMEELLDEGVGFPEFDEDDDDDDDDFDEDDDGYDDDVDDEDYLIGNGRYDDDDLEQVTEFVRSKAFKKISILLDEMQKRKASLLESNIEYSVKNKKIHLGVIDENAIRDTMALPEEDDGVPESTCTNPEVIGCYILALQQVYDIIRDEFLCTDSLFPKELDKPIAPRFLFQKAITIFFTNLLAVDYRYHAIHEKYITGLCNLLLTRVLFMWLNTIYTMDIVGKHKIKLNPTEYTISAEALSPSVNTWNPRFMDGANCVCFRYLPKVSHLSDSMYYFLLADAYRASYDHDPKMRGVYGLTYYNPFVLNAIKRSFYECPKPLTIELDMRFLMPTNSGESRRHKFLVPGTNLSNFSEELSGLAEDALMKKYDTKFDKFYTDVEQMIQFMYCGVDDVLHDPKVIRLIDKAKKKIPADAPHKVRLLDNLIAGFLHSTIIEILC
jgi:hypothetical protein